MMKVLFIGLGGAGQRLMCKMKNIAPDSEIFVIRLKDSPVLGKDFEPLAESFSVYYNYAQVINEKEAVNANFDIVFIATATNLHLHYAMQFIGKCKILFIEKPLGNNLEEAQLFYAAISASNTVCYVGHNRRFSCIWDRFKNIIANKQLKYCRMAAKTNFTKWHPNQPLSTLYVANKEMGGGAILTECHEIDLLQYLFGPILGIEARMHVSEKYNIETAVNYLINFETFYADICIDIESELAERKSSFVFEDCELVVDEIENVIICYNNSTEVEKIAITSMDSFDLEIIAIIDALNGKQDPRLATVKDAYDTMQLLLLAQNSVETTLHKKTSIFPVEFEMVVDRVLQELRILFNNKPFSVYGTGSLGYGGFVAKWSDFDIDVLAEFENIEESKIYYKLGKEIQEKLLLSGVERLDLRILGINQLNDKTTPSEFGQCSRILMLLDYAKIIYGRDVRNLLYRPNQQLVNEEACMLMIKLIANNDKWWFSCDWDDIAAFFALSARFIYTKDTGKVAGKRTAIEYLLEYHKHLISDEVFPWLSWALHLRTGKQDYLIADERRESAAANCRSLMLSVFLTFINETRNKTEITVDILKKALLERNVEKEKFEEIIKYFEEII
jgi:predicted dehydrogenase